MTYHCLLCVVGGTSPAGPAKSHHLLSLSLYYYVVTITTDPEAIENGEMDS
jgi:hypothetical protein